MNTDFRPPRTSRLAVGITYACLPLVSRLARRLVAVDFDKAEWNRLAELRERRFILTPNHPSSNDPLIAVWVARRLRRSFNYLACRELFDGPYGWLLQRLGCYSILRGAPDRESIRTTRALLAEHDRQVVIFPEGEIYGHNDLLLPFQSGVIQLGFWSLEALEKARRDLCLPVIPVVVKYLHVEEARDAIRAGLARLEAALRLPRDDNLSDYLRLRRIGVSVLAAVECEYRMKPPPERTPAERADDVKKTIMARVAGSIGVPVPVGNFAEGLHTLLNAVSEYAGEFSRDDSPYEQRLERRRIVAAQPLTQDLWRLQNMLAVSDGYVAAKMTTERFVEVLNRLEVEVTGRPRTFVTSRALVRVAEPLDLGARLEEYRGARRAAVAAATRDLESRTRALLEATADLGNPLER